MTRAPFFERLRVGVATRLLRAAHRLGVRPQGLRAFAGARSDRLTADLFSARTSGRQDLQYDLRKLRDRSRTLVRDTAEAKRYCGLFEENVAGVEGIQLKPAAIDTQGNAIDAVNDAVAAAWEAWGQPEHCTVDGQLGWVDLQQMLMRDWPRDGEQLVRLVEGRGPFGLQLQLLDPDQLDETHNVEPSVGGPWIRQGVELDPYGRPIAYHIFDGHPSDTRRGVRRRVPADQIIHLYLRWRPGTYRGVPWLHAAILDLNMLGGYDEATLVAARVAASAMGVIEGVGDEDPLGDTSAPDPMPVEFEPGRFVKLAPGEKLTPLDPKHPTTSYAEFHKARVRKIATAGNVSYTSLSGDLEAVNYSSIRAGLLSERDRYRMLQAHLVRHLHRRVYARWLVLAQLTGALPLRTTQLPQAARVRWQARGFPWVDPRADIEALRAEIRLGINSRTAAAAERGRDFEKVLEQIDAEERLATQYGVDVSGVDMPTNAAAVAADDTTTPPKRALRIANG